MATGGDTKDGALPRIVHLDRMTMGSFEIPRPDLPHEVHPHGVAA